MAVLLLIYSPLVMADMICSYSIAWKRIDEGERAILKSFAECNVAGYVNLRWDVSRFETLESGELSRCRLSSRITPSTSILRSMGKRPTSQRSAATR